MTASHLDPRVQLIRRFNRLYTQRIGVLEAKYLDSSYSLTQVRVLYELSHGCTTAASLSSKLGLDAGYLSRILKRFELDGLLTRKPSPSDARKSMLHLTQRGRRMSARFEQRASVDMTRLIHPLGPSEQTRLVQCMASIEQLLEPTPTERSYTLRPHRPGDLGFIVHRHGVLYAQEYGWDGRFEALVAEVTAKFLRHYDPRRERCWIAERNGELVGSVLVTRASRSSAQLRLLLVEPSARGLGIGRELVAECIRFARDAGYRTLTLWTNDVLHAARALYQAAGFRLIESEKHHLFGEDLTGQTWSLNLRD